MIVISELISTEHNNMYLYSQVTSRCQNIFSLGKLMNRNFLKKNEGVGGHSGKFRKVPWYFFVILFVKEVGGWLFSEISKSQHMFHQKSTCTPPPPPPPRLFPTIFYLIPFSQKKAPHFGPKKTIGYYICLCIYHTAILLKQRVFRLTIALKAKLLGILLFWQLKISILVDLWLLGIMFTVSTPGFLSFGDFWTRVVWKKLGFGGLGLGLGVLGSRRCAFQRTDMWFPQEFHGSGWAPWILHKIHGSEC